MEERMQRGRGRDGGSNSSDDAYRIGENKCVLRSN